VVVHSGDELTAQAITTLARVAIGVPGRLRRRDNKRWVTHHRIESLPLHWVQHIPLPKLYVYVIEDGVVAGKLQTPFADICANNMLRVLSKVESLDTASGSNVQGQANGVPHGALRQHHAGTTHTQHMLSRELRMQPSSGPVGRNPPCQVVGLVGRYLYAGPCPRAGDLQQLANLSEGAKQSFGIVGLNRISEQKEPDSDTEG
jgi:hypothetical protein